MKRFIMLVFLSLAFMSCQDSEAKTYRGELFMSFVDDFENGKSEEVYEIRVDNKMRKVIFAGRPPVEVSENIGKEIEIEGSETKDGDIIFIKLTSE